MTAHWIAEVVFSDPKKLQKLNAITHPRVFKEMERQIQEAVTELICMDVPLLFSTDFPFHCDKTVAVLAPKELRIQRVMKRDGISREETEARISAQLDDESLKNMADYCVINDRDLAHIQDAVHKVYCDIMG